MPNLLYREYKTGCYVGWAGDSQTPGDYCYGYGNNTASYYADLQPNTTYTIKRYDTSSRMRLGLSSQDLKTFNATSQSQVSYPFSQGFKIDSDDSVTFTTGADDIHLVVYYTNESEYDTRVMLNEGSTIQPYEKTKKSMYPPEWEMEGDCPVPIQSLQAVTDGFIEPYPASLWRIDENYGGLPYNDLMLDALTDGFVKPYPASLWRIDESNGGYPYNELMPDILYYEPPQPVHIKPVKQKPYITVYSYRTPQNGFDNHGLYILTPTRCTIVEALNGRYELSIEHPIDPEGRWEYIRENNIVKALGQLFTIRSVTQKWQGQSGKITAKADHIFYQLSDRWLESGLTAFVGMTVRDLLAIAGQHMISEVRPGQISYTYRYDTDMTVPVRAGLSRWNLFENGKTPIDFLMGSGGIMEVCGGEIHRDNFRFSLYERKEGAKDNAFEIRVGKNLTGITRTIDASNLCTYIIAHDNYGHTEKLAWAGQEGFGMPHYTVRELDFSYQIIPRQGVDVEATAAEFLHEDTVAYINSCGAPLISYDIDLIEVKNNPEFEEIVLTDEIKVGNKGYIYDKRIGGKVLIEITETTTDAMTGEVTNVLFGSKRNFMNLWNKTAIIDIETEVEELSVQIRDAEGAFCYDSEGSRIVEYEGV